MINLVELDQQLKLAARQIGLKSEDVTFNYRFEPEFWIDEKCMLRILDPTQKWRGEFPYEKITIQRYRIDSIYGGQPSKGTGGYSFSASAAVYVEPFHYPTVAMETILEVAKRRIVNAQSKVYKHLEAFHMIEDKING